MYFILSLGIEIHLAHSVGTISLSKHVSNNMKIKLNNGGCFKISFDKNKNYRSMKSQLLMETDIISIRR